MTRDQITAQLDTILTRYFEAQEEGMGEPNTADFVEFAYYGFATTGAYGGDDTSTQDPVTGEARTPARYVPAKGDRVTVELTAGTEPGTVALVRNETSRYADDPILGVYVDLDSNRQVYVGWSQVAPLPATA